LFDEVETQQKQADQNKSISGLETNKDILNYDDTPGNPSLPNETHVPSTVTNTRVIKLYDIEVFLEEAGIQPPEDPSKKVWGD
jgi:hypothetical protein